MSATELGVFARCFPVQPAADLARTVVEHGFATVQLNLSALGLPTIPDEASLAGIDLAAIARDFHDHELSIWGLSASYNMVHPEPGRAAEQTRQAAQLIRRSSELGVRAVTLCTGSRDPDDMWRAHADNASAGAWSDLLTNLEPLLSAAEEAGVLLAVEPEPGNVISDTAAALRLTTELGDGASRVGFILDPANLAGDNPPEKFEPVLRDAFDRLGAAAICVHAKDVVSWPARLAGEPGLDFELVRELHATLPHPVPLIIQDADPGNILAVRTLVRGRA